MSTNKSTDAFDVLCNLEPKLFGARAASLILETLMQHHFSDQVDDDGYQRLALNRDEVDALMHALYHVGDQIRAAQEAFDGARSVIVAAPARAA